MGLLNIHICNVYLQLATQLGFTRSYYFILGVHCILDYICNNWIQDITWMRIIIIILIIIIIINSVRYKIINDLRNKLIQKIQCSYK